MEQQQQQQPPPRRRGEEEDDDDDDDDQNDQNSRFNKQSNQQMLSIVAKTRAFQPVPARRRPSQLFDPDDLKEPPDMTLSTERLPPWEVKLGVFWVSTNQ